MLAAAWGTATRGSQRLAQNHNSARGYELARGICHSGGNRGTAADIRVASLKTAIERNPRFGELNVQRVVVVGEPGRQAANELLFLKNGSHHAFEEERFQTDGHCVLNPGTFTF